MNLKIRLAIVEDNASARIHLRSHLLSLGNIEIFSYSNGQELKTALRTQTIDVVMFDFHLGQHKNGVEWVQSLQRAGLIKPSTGIIFVTSDQTPQTIGQIVDLQPDFLIIKPYTIRQIKQTVSQYISVREKTINVLRCLDTGRNGQALTDLNQMLSAPEFMRIHMHLLKLKGKVLLNAQQYDDAIALYESVLAQSERVIWARWGLIKCWFKQGDWSACQRNICELLDIQLTKNKAFEWLACIAFEENNYERAEQWLDNIKISELTLQATRLKTLTYQMQQRVDEAIVLLERKRQSALSVREHRDELTFELADCHIKYATIASPVKRKENLHKARCLIGSAGRHAGDRQAHQRRDYMLSLANILEGDINRAKRLLENEWMHDFSRSEANTMIIAAQVWHGIGDEQRAQLILQQCNDKRADINDQIEQIITQIQVIEGEKTIGCALDSAMDQNRLGTESFVAQQHEAALSYFYNAFKLAEHIPAFAINLLHSMVKGHLSNYKGINTLNLVDQLKQQKLSETNRIRLQDIESTISENYATFAIPTNTEDFMLKRTENILSTNEASTLTPPQHRMH
jgi:DNA-binding NarL/FixJ family response regulator